MNCFIKLILVICLFSAASVHAQNNDLYNVKLKSGLVIKCEILRVVIDSFIIIRQYGQVNTIKYTDVSSVDFSESVLKPPAPASKEKPVYFRKNLPDSGFTFGIQTGFCFGQTQYSPTVSILLRLSVLKGFGKRWQAGAAIGIDPYLDYNIVLGSVMGEARYHFIKNEPRSPFLHGQGGYCFNINSSNAAKEGGGSYVLGIGQSFRNRHQDIFSIMFAYRVQKSKQEVRLLNNVTRTYQHVFNRLEFKVEFRF